MCAEDNGKVTSGEYGTSRAHLKLSANNIVCQLVCPVRIFGLALKLFSCDHMDCFCYVGLLLVQQYVSYCMLSCVNSRSGVQNRAVCICLLRLPFMSDFVYLVNAVQ